LQKIAAQLASYYKSEADSSQAAAFFLAGATFVSAAGTGPTFGTDGPVTGVLAFATSRAEYAAIGADTISALLNTYASGGNLIYFRNTLASTVASTVFKIPAKGGSELVKSASGLLGDMSGKAAELSAGEPQPPCQ
jgi:hypothetical protein